MLWTINLTSLFLSVYIHVPVSVLDVPINICSSITRSSSGNNTIYLASPNFIDKTSDNKREPCECEVIGTSMLVGILQLKFPFQMDHRGNLTLTGDITTWTSFPTTFLAYNLKSN